MAVVAARPLGVLEKNPPEIDIFFGSADEIEIDPRIEWIMVSIANGPYSSISIACFGRNFLTRF